MGRFLIRITTIVVSVYFILAYLIAQYCGVDILGDWHTILFELCALVCCFEQGKYHCKYLRFLLLSLLLSDLLTKLDIKYDFLSVSQHNLIPIAIIALGITTSLTLALRHFYKVSKLKRKR